MTSEPLPHTPGSGQDVWARQLAMEALHQAEGSLSACRIGSARTPAVILGGKAGTVTIVWKTPFPTDEYTIEAVEGPGLIGQAVLTVESQTADGCVITVTATTTVVAGATVLAHGYS